MSKLICESQSKDLPVWDGTAFTDGTACVVDFAREQMDLARRASCGKDVLCREGTLQAKAILADLSQGKGEGEDLELLSELWTLISQNAGCELSKTAAGRCLTLLEDYPEEWDQHLRRKRCTNLICKMSFLLYIAPERCDGCGKCVTVCPEDAIAGGTDLIHVIELEACTKCMACVEACPKGAIQKASASGVKPKVPAEPVPVGSFGSAAGEEGDEGGGMRRRRRG